MSMTRKDFKLVAEAVAFVIGQDQSDLAVHDPMAELIDELTYQLSKRNKNFDSDKFSSYITKRSAEVKVNLNKIAKEESRCRR
jgi:hypothetical protein